MKKILISFIIAIVLISLIFFRLPRAKKSAPIRAEDIKIIDLEDKSAGGASLKVLSANLMAEFETQPAPRTSPTPQQESSASFQIAQPYETPPSPAPQKIKSLRILGEILNTGTKSVTDATALVTFYDADGFQLATKVASFSDNYFFPRLDPQEKFLYDIALKDLPENFINLSVSFSPASSSSTAPSFSKVLKLENREVEEKLAASDTNQEVYYYTLRGQMVHTGDKPVKNARAVAYVKDRDNRVFAWNKQEFPSDLFSPGQRQNISINLLPIKEGRMEQLEVFFFGEEL